MPRTQFRLPPCQTLNRGSKISNRLSETQYKCSQGDPFEKLGGGSAMGVGGRGF